MHYRKHIFCCVNERVENHPRSCCSARGSVELRGYMKARAKELGIDDVRVNNAGCLERCELGPAMVVYPEGVWYHYNNTRDVDEILESHILGGQPVKRLLLRDSQKFPDDLPVERLFLLVTDITRLNDSIVLVEFKDPGGENLPSFSAGSYLSLLVENDRTRKCFAIINSPNENSRYQIAVEKSSSDRSGTNWVFSKIKVGSIIQSRYPENTFPLDESAKQYLLVADGIGISPILSMSHRLRAIGADFQIHYQVLSKKFAFFVDELRANFGEHLTLHQGNFDSTSLTSIEKAMQIHEQGSHLYLAGSCHFIFAVLNVASDWSEEAIHTQYFSAERTEPETSHEFVVSLARRQKNLRVGEDKSVLQVLRAVGMPVDYACENGLCGACKVKVLFGKVDHRDNVLTRSEKARHDSMMTCVSRAAAGESRLILDI